VRPERLIASLRPKIWGATDLSPWFPNSTEKMGEAWFLSEKGPLPLLIKFIFTTDKLSVQVHPGDDYARQHENSPGKTEMWHVLRAEPGAKIAAGLREAISPERLREASLSGEIETLLDWREAAPGDTFFIPAGTIHALGGGLAVCEVQQPSDVTYRLYDYLRPRPLHLEQAIAVSTLAPHGGKATPRRLGDGVSRLAGCSYFVADLLEWSGARAYRPETGSDEYLVVLEGAGFFDDTPFRAGEAWRVAVNSPAFPISSTGSFKLLRAWVP